MPKPTAENGNRNSPPPLNDPTGWALVWHLLGSALTAILFGIAVIGLLSSVGCGTTPSPTSRS